MHFTAVARTIGASFSDWSGRRSRLWSLGFAAAALVGLLAVVLTNAWVSDDGFITFRSVEQFFAGYGPRWNPHERVQAFTHPLWFGFVCLVRVFTRDVFFNVLLLSLACAALMSWLLGRIAKSRWQWTIGLLILASSKAFVDFATSGLENPLSHVMILAFLLVLLRLDARGSATRHQRLVMLTFLLGLAVTVRLDLVTLLLVPYLFALLGTIWVEGRITARLVAKLILALLPPLAWTVFSVIYYGFPFPNTAYAKLGAGVPAAELWPHGVSYLANSLRLDCITLVVTATSVVLAFASRRAVFAAVAIGIACNIFYVMRVGGDFMSGRFLTPALVMGVGLLVAMRWRLLVIPSLLLMLLIYNVAQPFAPWRTDVTYINKEIDPSGIADERGYYFQHSSIWRYLETVQEGTLYPKIIWVKDAVEFANSTYSATVMPAIGYFGYYVRLDQIVIDPMALSDPLLARIPTRKGWRIGHMVRDMPDGYIQSIAEGRNMITDPGVRRLYDELELVTRGPLFSAERWRAIWALNIGS